MSRPGAATGALVLSSVLVLLVLGTAAWIGIGSWLATRRYGDEPPGSFAGVVVVLLVVAAALPAALTVLGWLARRQENRVVTAVTTTLAGLLLALLGAWLGSGSGSAWGVLLGVPGLLVVVLALVGVTGRTRGR